MPIIIVTVLTLIVVIAVVETCSRWHLATDALAVCCLLAVGPLEPTRSLR